MFIKLITVASLFFYACGVADQTLAGSDGPPRSGPPSTSTDPTPAPKGARFAALTIELELEALTLRSGDEVGSRLTVSNASGKDVVDPSCLLGTGRYALVPGDHPEAELWLQPVADCAGDFRMKDGFRETYAGPSFPARTKQGSALPPGGYLATLEIEGYPKRLVQPVEVTS